ncbi:hypothetical protein PUN28_002199 [Cardiocondyla obscurior]|uniref:SWIM-type domain-containing protein n=1 Tax=Cardiocondyla obscurior TaxID=286306 RepID=A0AAW2GT31_9HYME
MRVSIQEICKFASVTPTSRNFTGGKNIIDHDHLLTCGTVCYDSDYYQSLAFCLQTTSLKSEPHEINGQISKNGKIIGIECSCAVGAGTTYKHIVAVLLFCNRNNLEEFKDITCTDKKCVLSALHKSALENYEMKPLLEHKCFEEKLKKDEKVKEKKSRKSGNAVAKTPSNDNTPADTSTSTDPSPCLSNGLTELSETEYDEFLRIMVEDNLQSALAKHM